MRWRKRRPRASVSTQLRISNARDFYVEGDVISGDIVITVLDAECCVRSLSVELICTEHINLPGHNPQTAVFVRNSSEVLGDKKKMLPTGCHCFSYTVHIPNEHGYYPASLCVPESSGCGVEWCLRAIAVIERHGAEDPQTLKDDATIAVFTLPTEDELLNIGRLRKFSRRFVDDITVSMECSKYLPRAPNTCNAVLRVELASPAYVKSVNVYIEQTIVAWNSIAANVFVKYEPLEKIFVDKVIRTLELDGKSRGWQVKGPLPSSVRSCCSRMHVQHYIRMCVVMGSGREHLMRWSGISISSPALVRAASKVAPLRDDKATIENANEPPAYSEA